MKFVLIKMSKFVVILKLGNKMKQVILNVPESKYSAFMRLVKSVGYVSLPNQTEKKKKNKLSEKFRAKIPKEVGLEMHKQLEALRNEWERDI
jgi:hypothetical protein